MRQVRGWVGRLMGGGPLPPAPAHNGGRAFLLAFWLSPHPNALRVFTLGRIPLQAQAGEQGERQLQGSQVTIAGRERSG